MTEYGPTHNRKAPPGWVFRADGKSCICNKHPETHAVEKLSVAVRHWEEARRLYANQASNAARTKYGTMFPKPTIEQFLKTKVTK